jgi:hypothetical protein
MNNASAALVVVAFCLVVGREAEPQGLPDRAAGISLVANNATLLALGAPLPPYVLRQGYWSAGDGGAAYYKLSTSPCPLHGGNGDGGSQIKASDGNCWIAGFGETSPLSVKLWGAVGDGVTDSSPALIACIAASAASSISCMIPVGTFVIDNIPLVSGASVMGQSQAGSVLRRKAGSSSAAPLSCNACSHITVMDLTIDGNRSNETEAANTLQFTNYADIHLHRVIVSGTKGGTAVHFDTSTDRATNTFSEITDSRTSLNDGNGTVVIGPAWWFHATDLVALGNGMDGLAIGDIYRTSGTPIANTLQHIRVNGGHFDGNGDSGLLVRGFIAGYVNGQPVYGPGTEPVFDAIISGVSCSDNGAYGCVLQAAKSVIRDSVASNNARSVTFGAGGFLGPCEQCEFVNLTSFSNAAANSGYGLDIGCSLGTHVRGGHFSGNTIGINIGCSSYSDVRGATIDNNGTGITVYSGEASGDSYGISGFTQTLIISDNRIQCENIAATGILTNGGAFGVQISNNYFQGCDPFKTVVTDALSADISNNVNISVAAHGPQWFAQSDVTINAATGALVIPDWASVVTLTGVNHISTIHRSSAHAIGTGVSALVVNAPGQNYPQHPRVTISGCSTPPVIAASFANRGGQFTGVQFSSRGSGCVNPTASVSGGTGAVTTVYTGATLAGTHKELTLIVGAAGSLTFLPGGNIISNGALSGAGANTIVKLLDSEGSVTEISRALH